MRDRANSSAGIPACGAAVQVTDRKVPLGMSWSSCAVQARHRFSVGRGHIRQYDTQLCCGRTGFGLVGHHEDHRGHPAAPAMIGGHRDMRPSWSRRQQGCQRQAGSNGGASRRRHDGPGAPVPAIIGDAEFRNRRSSPVRTYMTSRCSWDWHSRRRAGRRRNRAHTCRASTCSWGWCTLRHARWFCCSWFVSFQWPGTGWVSSVLLRRDSTIVSAINTSSRVLPRSMARGHHR